MILALFLSVQDGVLLLVLVYVLRVYCIIRSLFCLRRDTVRFSRREHLLTEMPLPGPAASLIVVKGLLSQGGARGIGVGGGVQQQQQLPGEWLLVVSRVDGTIQRFAARGVDLIEPGTGLSYSCKCAH